MPKNLKPVFPGILKGAFLLWAPLTVVACVVAGWATWPQAGPTYWDQHDVYRGAVLGTAFAMTMAFHLVLLPMR